jgi:hypothetical protein
MRSLIAAWTRSAAAMLMRVLPSQGISLSTSIAIAPPRTSKLAWLET